MHNLFRRQIRILASCFLLTVFWGGNAAGVPLSEPTSSSRINQHNFSKNSKATIRSSNETQICIFCHTPHGASAQSTLWNRKAPEGPNAYLLNTSSTLAIGNNTKVPTADTGYVEDSTIYPNGSTRLCMSCHDGVTAIGTILNGVINNGDGDAILSAKATKVVDLTTAHPVSFVYKSSGDSVLAAINSAKGDTFQYPALATVPLDGEGRMQCTTCHDPHEDTRGTDADQYPFWRHVVVGNYVASFDDVCAACHKAAQIRGPHPPLPLP